MNDVSRSTLVLVLVAMASCGGATDDERMDSAVAAMSCAELASIDIPGLTVTAATAVPSGAFEGPPSRMPGVSIDYSVLPAFCRLEGSLAPTVQSDIRFELWLPESGWNGRFMQTGNGGAAGAIVHASLIQPLLRGYAVANTDTGHMGGGGDFAWALGEPEKLIDYQYRAVHELTVAGKSLTAARYGSQPEKSYWLGCSTGGRQGLKEAQLYPDDYDAIIAGAPASNWTPLTTYSMQLETRIGDELPVEKLSLLNDAAMAACDELDQVADGVISNLAACDFDPAALGCEGEQGEACLTDDEVAAATYIYGGLRAGDGSRLFPGTGPGSEPELGVFATPLFKIGSSYYRHVVKQDPDWDAETFDMETDYAEALTLDDAMTAMDPVLAPFFERGGKLLTYHGTADGLIPYGNTVDYYNDVVGTLGAGPVDDSLRFYLVPGMGHCRGGNGASEIDWLSAMEQWVEEGQVPGVLTGRHPADEDGSGGFARPVCPFPSAAVWDGVGDPSDSASFTCR